MAIHQEVVFDAAPDEVYRALIDETRFSAMSGGAPTSISGEAGGAFSCFGGMIEGRNVELVPGRRVVQAWRVKNWDPGLYSIARFELVPEGAKTKLVFDHDGFPAEQETHLAQGWGSNYWEPLRAALGR